MVNKFKSDRWFLRQKTICQQPGYQVGNKIGKAAMSGMFYLTNIFKFVVDRFYHCSFADH
ncbi:hypothetical protein EZS27_012210 [termite gut metagenome]|uniref:Uncharacterized protein n=1 Tax=termite gut metagenome TaxID=433724 RepID=A0A5J4S1C5_9ZZZZ